MRTGILGYAWLGVSAREEFVSNGYNLLGSAAHVAKPLGRKQSLFAAQHSPANDSATAWRLIYRQHPCGLESNGHRACNSRPCWPVRQGTQPRVLYFKMIRTPYIMRSDTRGSAATPRRPRLPSRLRERDFYGPLGKQGPSSSPSGACVVLVAV